LIKFLADVNIEKTIVNEIRNCGYDILWVADYDCQMSDEALLKLANDEDRILITNDKDFGELIFYQNKISSGVILFRIPGHNVERKRKSLQKLLEKYRDKIPGSFVVVSGKKIRFKTLGNP